MPNNYPYIITLCKQIALSGKTPSLALIRNKSNRPLAIPEVIQALKNWKEDPEQEVPADDAVQAPEVTQTLKQRVEHLEQQVQALQRQLSQLTGKNKSE